MAIRYDDVERTITLSVRDLVESVPPNGDLVLDIAQRSLTRMAAGRKVHQEWQAERAGEDDRFRAEVTLRHRFEIDGWSIQLVGRLDGLADEQGHTVVEEVKSTALDSSRLHATQPADWPLWTAQLHIYLWMLLEGRRPSPVGRLVLISLLDGGRHILGVMPEPDVGRVIVGRIASLVRARERHLAWLARRRTVQVPAAFGVWRAGQERIRDAVQDALGRGARLLVQAPTGLGKTAAVIHGALVHALRHDRRVFWATARNTQQAAITATLDRMRATGAPIQYVVLRAKERVCLNEVVSCRPDTCRFAAGYYERRDAAGLSAVLAAEPLHAERAMELGREHSLCPFALAMDAIAEADVVIGDMNYAISPYGSVARLFGEEQARTTVLVADEAHQLIERARDHASPRLAVADVQAAREHLRARGPGFTAFLDACDDIQDQILWVVSQTAGPVVDGEAEASLLLDPWRELGERIDAVAYDYALLKAEAGLAGTADPWLDLARAVLRFVDLAEVADETTKALVRVRTSEESLRLLCLDPSGLLRPRLAALAGFIGCSATLTPPAFYRDLLGLPADTERVEVGSPFPAANQRVIVAPQVSTAWRDRQAHAAPTAALLDDLIRAVPGNVAVYMPSFAMLGDLAARLCHGRRTLVQRSDLREEERASWLGALATAQEPIVLCAVLGGIFAEGIDLPAGALDAVIVVGPALPPTGLERDLLRACYEERYGDGFLYASLVPGLTRVVQAAGRLIRRPEDRGVIVLVDRRFVWKDVAGLLPAAWGASRSDDPAAEVRAFFAGPGSAPAPEPGDERTSDGDDLAPESG